MEDFYRKYHGYEFLAKKMLHNELNFNKKNYSFNFRDTYNIELGEVTPYKILVSKYGRSKLSCLIKFTVDESIRNKIKLIEKICRESLSSLGYNLKIKSIAGKNTILVKINRRTYEYMGLNPHIPYIAGWEGREMIEVPYFELKNKTKITVGNKIEGLILQLSSVNIKKKIGRITTLLES